MFKQLLEDLLQRVDGSVAACVGDMDGLLVECQYRSDACNCEQLTADCAVLLKSANAVAAGLAASSLEEVSILAGDFRFILRLLADNYFVALVLSEQGHLGKARFALRKMHSSFKSELAL